MGKITGVLSLISALILLSFPFIINIAGISYRGMYLYSGLYSFFYAVFGLIILVGSIMNLKRRRGLAGSFLILIFSILSFVFVFALTPYTFDWGQIYVGIGSILGIIAGSIEIYKAETTTPVPVPKPQAFI